MKNSRILFKKKALEKTSYSQDKSSLIAIKFIVLYFYRLFLVFSSKHYTKWVDVFHFKNAITLPSLLVSIRRISKIVHLFIHI